MMKSILFILCVGLLLANDLLLSAQKTELLKLKPNKIEKDANLQKRSWVSPLIFSLSANKSKDTSDLKSNTNSAAVEWSQDLFRSMASTTLSSRQMHCAKQTSSMHFGMNKNQS